MPERKHLTARQELFAQGVASGLDQSAAYRKAYPASLKWLEKTVWTRASEMAADRKVLGRVQVLQALSAEIAVLDGAEIMREIKRVALSDIGGIMGPDGKVLMPNELDAATRAAVASFEIDEYGRVKYKFWDKNSALTNAAKIKGLFEIDNAQQNKAPLVISVTMVKPGDASDQT